MKQLPYHIEKVSERIEFSNLESRLTFGYKFNNVKGGEPKSCTFSYKNRLSMSIDGFDDVFSVFSDKINGKEYCGLFVEKYPLDSTYTYLIADTNGGYKIGKSKNPLKRLQQLRTGNPNCVLLCYSNLVSEKLLHDLFSNQNESLEWFRLNSHEVFLIKEIMLLKNKYSVDCILRMNGNKLSRNKKQAIIRKTSPLVKMTFGKHKGKIISKMDSDSEIRYLKWLMSEMLFKNDTDKIIYKAIEKKLKSILF